jgi:hypothetical protein
MQTQEMSSQRVTRVEVRWAIVHLIFTALQIGGATASLVFLLQLGWHWLTFAAVGITLLVTICSRILFSRRDATTGK